MLQSPWNKDGDCKKKKHLVCWKFKQHWHQKQNDSSCIASLKLKKQQIVLCLLCCRYVILEFRRKKYIHMKHLLNSVILCLNVRAKLIKHYMCDNNWIQKSVSDDRWMLYVLTWILWCSLLDFVLELFISSSAAIQGNIFSYFSLMEKGFFFLILPW